MILLPSDRRRENLGVAVKVYCILKTAVRLKIMSSATVLNTQGRMLAFLLRG